MNKHKFRRAMQKVALKITRLLNHESSKQYHTEYDRESYAICNKLMHDSESILLMSPISGKRYIKNDKMQIFVILERSMITIVNHQYSYNIEVWGKPMHRIERLFDVEVEKRRQAMENEIRSNVKHSLSNIYKTLKHEKI
jgi:hypothetical protein